MRSIGIIGLGHVGRQLATALVDRQLVDQLILIDQNDDLAIAMQTELTDLGAVNACQPTIKIQDWAALGHAEIVVTAFGNSELKRDDPMGELQVNQRAAAAVGHLLQSNHFAGILINVSDPNEAVTAYLQIKAQLTPRRVIGVGTCLDTIHLHQAVAEASHLAPGAVSGFVYGQHNGKQVFAWSTVTVNGQSIDHAINGHRLDQNQLQVNTDIRNWYTLKGLRYNAVAISEIVVQLVQAIWMNQQRPFSVAIYQPQYETYVSFPTLINRQGQGNPLLLDLYPVEQTAVQVAADAIQQQIAALKQLEGEQDD